MLRDFPMSGGVVQAGLEAGHEECDVAHRSLEWESSHHRAKVWKTRLRQAEFGLGNEDRHLIQFAWTLFCPCRHDRSASRPSRNVTCASLLAATLVQSLVLPSLGRCHARRV